jgi:hypothetical protein
MLLNLFLHAMMSLLLYVAGLYFFTRSARYFYQMGDGVYWKAEFTVAFYDQMHAPAQDHSGP